MRNTIVFFSIVLLASACVRKNSDTPQPTVSKGNLEIQMGYRFDNSSMLFDTIAFTNAANYKMSVSRIQFYLSNFLLLKSDGTNIPYNGAFYFDAKDANFNKIVLNGLPVGDYTGLTFNLGLDSTTNKSNSLPATPENNNMNWPDPMGGGYHFMKMEGLFIDTGAVFGYAVHLGTDLIGSNISLVKIILANKPFTISATNANINLTMNVAEWYKNPAIYDFDKDGNFTMGIAASMLKIKNNGSDVFN